MGIAARGSKSKVYCHGEVVYPNFVHTACNSMNFVRIDGVCTNSRQKKYAILTIV